MTNVYKFFVTMFAAFGVFMAGMVAVAVIGDEQPETDREVQFASPTDFVNIVPRTVWPEELGDSGDFDRQCAQNFIASFEARGTRLDADQKQVVRFVIVPRLKELTARSIDKAKAQGFTEDEDIARVMIEDVCVFSPRYAKAMATILRADAIEKGRIDAITGDVAINAANAVEDR